MTPLESALLKTLIAAQEYISTGRVQAAHEIITLTISEATKRNLNPTTGEPQCHSN